MNYFELKELETKLYFSIHDVADLLNISIESARVQCSRYYKKGFFLRLKKNFYIFKTRWDNLNKEYFFRIANILQVPSYISFMTALIYYEVSTQVQQNYFECACLKRKKEYEIDNSAFIYYMLKKDYYSDFENINGLFIAQKEKAMVDCIYMSAIGKYKFDINSIDMNKLNIKKILKILKKYPNRIKLKAEEICRI